MCTTLRASIVLALSFLATLCWTTGASADQRKFGVMLATSPKSGAPVLPNLDDVWNQYFNMVDPTVGSFAEYWNEISYGAVTVSGDVVGWIHLPWPILPAVVDGKAHAVQKLGNSGSGPAAWWFKGESFSDGAPMYEATDIARWSHVTNVTTATEAPPVDNWWTPGERFMDLNGDGRYSGYIEESYDGYNQTTGSATPPACANPDGIIGLNEFDDGDGDGIWDIPEPFEDFIRVYVWNSDPTKRWVKCDPSAKNTDPVSRQWAIDYINANYPGVDSTGASTAAVIIAHCGNGKYDGPERWSESGSTKMRYNGTAGGTTPRPCDEPPSTANPAGSPSANPWKWDYDGWWQAYFTDMHTATPNAVMPATIPPAPTWTSSVPDMQEFDPTAARVFEPNVGGTKARSGLNNFPLPAPSGNTCMGTVDPASVGNGDMDGGYLVHRGTTIYPDATGYYDGPAEFSDLPSSIYHNQAKTVSGLSAPGLNGGDGRLGEVTSPANTSQFGQDRGSGNPTGNKPTDGLIGPGGPGAYNLSGQNGYDAGNVLNLEYLTWFHAGASDPDYIPTTPVEALKRDYNLDGLLDQGAVRLPGTENYAWDDDSGNSNDGSPGEFYPFNRKRLTEDAVAALDASTDWNNMVAGAGTQNPVFSGFTLLPGGLYPGGLAPGGRGLFQLPAPGMDLPIWTRIDKTVSSNTADLTANTYSNTRTIAYSDFATSVDTLGETGDSDQSGFGKGLMEHEFLHSWEGYPDLYDYDQYLTGPIINNEPIGGWCIMAGGPVHPVPILKETSGWIKSNDLTEILPPSLEWPVTIKDYAFDPVNSVYYFGNPAYAGESFYFWRDTGYDYTVTYPYRSNFNRSAPGDGLVIMHADLGANPAGLPQQQRLNSHFIYSIVQADGLHQLEAGENGGDSGDCFPGSRRVTKWNDTTNPSSRWYGQLPSGLSITNIVQEDTQSVVTFLWQPHIVPELRFINPPAGVIMGTGASAYFPLKYEAWDAYGGTTIRLFVIDGATKATNPYGGTEITGSPLTKLPGAVQDNFQVPLTAMPRDGMYYFYAELTPGTSTANGLTENFYSAPRAGRMNSGRGSIGGLAVDIALSKLETWTIECVDETAPGQEVWQVKGTVSGLQANRAVTGVDYSTDDKALSFRIDWEGITPADAAVVSVSNTGGLFTLVDPSPSKPFVGSEFKANDTVRILTGPKPGWYIVKSIIDATTLELATDAGNGTGVSYRAQSFKANGVVTPSDRFTIGTTGKTPHSLPIRLLHGQLVPTVNAVINVTFPNDPYNPQHRLPLLTRFDGSGSRDEAGQINSQLTYLWNFGDGSVTETGAIVTHTYSTYRAGGYTATLTVTNPATAASSTVTTLVMALPGDADNDGVEDPSDNCPTVYNPDQADADGNGIGDVCDVGIITEVVVVPNPKPKTEATTTVTVPEGGTATFRVKLTMAPPPPTTLMEVTVAPAATPVPDADITITNGGTLFFTDENWDTYQEVTLSAATDVDVCNGQAVIVLTSPNPSKPTYLTTTEVLAVEQDMNTLAVIANKSSVRVTEGSTNTVQVRLNAQPCADTLVTPSLVAGSDSTLSLANANPLTFTTKNWSAYQTVTLAAGKDVDVCAGTGTLRLSSPGVADKDVPVTVDETTALSILADTTSIAVPEGGNASFRLKLGAQPCADTTVNLALVAGNSHIHLTNAGQTTLTFTKANWDAYQTVSLTADSDADAVIEQATITCSATGAGSVVVTAVESEKDVIYILSDVDALTLQEGTTGTVRVRLSGAPQANVIVTATMSLASSPLLVLSGQMLTFTPTNWGTYQSISIRAGWDTNITDDSVMMNLTAPGCEPKSVALTQRDTDTVIQSDRDGDGVPDSKDNCPAVANADQKDTDGDGIGDACDTCPKDKDNDADHDGVCGDVDLCPNTPVGEQADVNGCSCSQRDTDNDGVNDCLDECPNTEAGQTVDVRGCACSDGDADGDGVNDCNDKCPNTPTGAKVDADGCPVAAMTVNAGADQSVLTGHSTTLTATVTGGLAPYTYAWTASGFTGGTASVLVAPQSSTVYTVKVTDSVGQTATDTMLVTITSVAKIQVSRSVDGATTVVSTEGYYIGLAAQISVPTAPSGYTFSHWSGDVSGTDNPVTVLVDDNKSIVANFVASSDTGRTLPSLLPFNCGSGIVGSTVASLFGMLMLMSGRSYRRTRRW